MLTHSLSEFEANSSIEKEISNADFYQNSSEVVDDSKVEQAMWTESFEKLPLSNSLVIPSTFEASKLDLKPFSQELKYAFLGEEDLSCHSH